MAARGDPEPVADLQGQTGRRPELEPARGPGPALDLVRRPGIGAGLEDQQALVEPAVPIGIQCGVGVELAIVVDQRHLGSAGETLARGEHRGAVRGGVPDRDLIGGLDGRVRGARARALVDPVVEVLGKGAAGVGGAHELARGIDGAARDHARPQGEPAPRIAQVRPAVGTVQFQGVLGERLRQAPQLGGEVACGVSLVSPSVPRRSRIWPWPSGSSQLTNEIAIPAPSNRPARTSSSTMPPSANTPTRSRLSTANPASLRIAVRAKPASAR